ncbi:hypothetical protein GCM10010220_01170 [Streptomyces parvulus]|nr:hypothetical protein GCM10010220_01170 [Streptomyces parvulus]
MTIKGPLAGGPPRRPPATGGGSGVMFPAMFASPFDSRPYGEPESGPRLNGRHDVSGKEIRP